MTNDILTRLEAFPKINGAHMKDVEDAIKEIKKLRSIPMKYRRMEFNAKLQEENQRLLDRIEGLEKEVEYLILESDSLYDQLKYANQC